MKQKPPESKPLQQFAPADFFVWRTPLLPFDELLACGARLAAPAALAEPEHLAAALAHDRMRMRDHLAAAYARPAVREALFFASPELEEMLDLWRREPDSKRGQKVEHTLARYLLRMAGRATPFGLFAGCSLGTIADETRLVLQGQAKYQRHTRLDMDYLFALAETLAREPALRTAFVYFPNTSLYRVAGRMRYVELRLDGKRRTHHLVAVAATEYLAAVLERAAAGATLAELTAVLAAKDVAQSAAEKYLAELIENQVLIPGLTLPVTGTEPIHPLIEQLSAHAAPVAEHLAQARDALAALDAAGLGAEPSRYRALAKTLETLPTPVELATLFQVDLVKPAPAATLGGAVLDEIKRGVAILHRLFGRVRAGDLGRFADAFTARYEGREVPLVEALDEENGIGYPPGGGADVTPLLQGLAFPARPIETAEWNALDALLLNKLTQALASQAQEIKLEPADLELFKSKEVPPLPDAFAVLATIAAADDAALTNGDFRVHLRAAAGPSGAPLLGRFCHADAALQQHVERHLRAEEALQPEAIFAEIVYLPEGRLGNILLRPVLREHEIAYLGRSGAALEQQIPITDLLVSVRDGRVHLRSARLGREVIPRLTTAHAFDQSSSGAYRFLATLQFQNVAAGMGWDWGVLTAAPFLPRVTVGRLVLALARWRMNKEEIKRLSATEGVARYQAFQQWRSERRLPRWIAFADGDNLLPLDLDNTFCLDALVHVLKHREAPELLELFPEPEQLCANGPEGRFVHELIVPFERQGEEERGRGGEREKGGQEGSETVTQRGVLSHSPTLPLSLSPSPRRFPPGSDWLYAKLYTGAAVADQVLCELVRPLTEGLLKSGAIESWFFIRYADPDWHLRLRFQGAPERLLQEALPALQAAAQPFFADGRLWRLQLDTYEREVERYGGDVGMPLAEQLFYADSETALEIIEALEPGDAGLDERWRLTLCGMDGLLNDLGFDLPAKHTLLAAVRKGFAKEFRADEAFIGQLGDRFRKERKDLAALLDPASATDHLLWPGIEILKRRSRLAAVALAELQAAAQSGRLSVSLADLAASLLHMHANRLLRSAARAQEMVLYDFLARLYESQLARAAAAQPEGL